MIHFSDRVALTFGHHCFLDQHPGVADDPLSLFAFLQHKNLLNEEAIKKYVSEELGVMRSANINKKN